MTGTMQVGKKKRFLKAKGSNFLFVMLLSGPLG